MEERERRQTDEVTTPANLPTSEPWAHNPPVASKKALTVNQTKISLSVSMILKRDVRRTLRRSSTLSCMVQYRLSFITSASYTHPKKKEREGEGTEGTNVTRSEAEDEPIQRRQIFRGNLWPIGLRSSVYIIQSQNTKTRKTYLAVSERATCEKKILSIRKGRKTRTHLGEDFLRKGLFDLILDRDRSGLFDTSHDGLC